MKALSGSLLDIFSHDSCPRSVEDYYWRYKTNLNEARCSLSIPSYRFCKTLHYLERTGK